jgi:glutamate dehydrogenase/leucine dehydrogenase
MSNQENSEPTIITLDNSNSVQILSQYVELAQQKGAFLLSEAELLKRATDVLLNGTQDAEVNRENAKQLLIQGVHKGQRHGSYTLNDAALLSKVVQYCTQTQSVQPQVSSHLADDDLSDLAEPIPLKPKEV